MQDAKILWYSFFFPCLVQTDTTFIDIVPHRHALSMHRDRLNTITLHACTRVNYIKMFYVLTYVYYYVSVSTLYLQYHAQSYLQDLVIIIIITKNVCFQR